MLVFSILFCLGIVLVSQLSLLPNVSLLMLLISLLIILSIYFKKITHYTNYFIPLLLGCMWCTWYSHTQLSWVLTPDQEGKPLQLTGFISTIPDRQEYHTSFRLLVNEIQSPTTIKPVHATIQLSWQSAPKNLHVGDEWKVTAYLKRTKGLMNPGGFDFEKWSFQEGIRATGYVENNKGILMESHWYHHPLDRIREYLKDHIHNNLKKTATSHWITALAIGERYNIPLDDWKVLRNTGTNHLMAIAGLHIGFMAGFALMIVTWFWRRSPALVLKIPAQHAGAMAALLMALIYSALAGFSIPTQRACFMLSIFLFTLLSRRKILSWQSWSAALLCVLLINPLCVLSVSFWLSFSSIALIIYGVRGRLAPSGVWWKHGRIQWVIALGLIPLSIGLFQECSWVSLIANSIAIPCVGFLVVPLTLLGCLLLVFSGKIGGFFLFLADKLLSWLWVVLSYLSHLTWSSSYLQVPSIVSIIAACLGAVILLIPIGFPGRAFGFVFLLPLFFYKPPAPPVGDVWLTVLDVGQGLSVVLQTHQHVLLFDAGARSSEKNDMGESVVIPFLHSIGIKHIDRMVISHGDNDHIGGSFAVLNQFPTYLVKSSVPEKFLNVPASYCLRGEKWQWDEVSFEFLYPTSDKLGLNNDSSCVLRITNGVHQLLLTGDIEKLAEYSLIQYPDELVADVLVAPHHGSKTSALAQFVEDVHPKIVIFAVGYRNRYHFPNPAVLEQYQKIGAVTVDTAQSGAIRLQLSRAVNIRLLPELYRINHQQFWS